MVGQAIYHLIAGVEVGQYVRNIQMFAAKRYKWHILLHRNKSKSHTGNQIFINFGLICPKRVDHLKYARLLAKNKDLTLEEIIMLDKVQKKQSLTEFEEKHLKSKKLVEGRKPNYYIGIKVAEKTGQKAAYSKNKAFDKSYYLDLIEKSIREHTNLERKDVDELLWSKLPDWMDDKQKKNKIGNLLSELRMKHKIENSGSYSKPRWSLKRWFS